jgi:hypothetical protein
LIQLVEGDSLGLGRSSRTQGQEASARRANLLQVNPEIAKALLQLDLRWRLERARARQVGIDATGIECAIDCARTR